MLPACRVGTGHPVEVRHEGSPLVDEEEDGDGGHGEDHDDEEVADLGHAFTTQPALAGVDSIAAAGTHAAAQTLQQAGTHYYFIITARCSDVI